MVNISKCKTLVVCRLQLINCSKHVFIVFNLMDRNNNLSDSKCTCLGCTFYNFLKFTDCCHDGQSEEEGLREGPAVDPVIGSVVVEVVDVANDELLKLGQIFRNLQKKTRCSCCVRADCLLL